MILTGENKSTGLKTCPTTNLPTINTTLTGLRANLGHCCKRLVTKHLNHDTTCDVKHTAGIIHNLCVLVHTMGWKVQGSIPGGDERFIFSKT
jgi:hypothetical protein